ncbi:MAG: hypothetical protein RR386_00915 [Bacteroidaceae bacterium]
MKREELTHRTLKENPFKVPEGYFDDFATKLMANLPPKEREASEPTAHISFFTRVKPYLYLAAMFIGLYFGIQVFKFQADKINKQNQVDYEQTAEIKKITTDEYVDQICNYAMVDNEDVYTCMTEDY